MAPTGSMGSTRFIGSIGSARSIGSTAELSLRAITHNTCYGWAHLMLRVIKVEAESGAIYFSDMLWVNLHLLWLLQNLMTALYRLYRICRICKVYRIYRIYKIYKIRSCRSLKSWRSYIFCRSIYTVHLVDLKDPVGPIDLVVYGTVSASESYKIYGINRI